MASSLSLLLLALAACAEAFSPIGARPMAMAASPRVAVQPAMQLFGKKKTVEEVLEEKG